ncbi:MAG: hypothetical protein JWQ19_1005 [Subtercola sp.]|nr:hypothetical protein [Subtercola sp.]
MAARRFESTGSTGTLLHIDWTRCDGRGLCTELLGDQLDRDEWGYPLARVDSGSLEARDRSNVPIPADQQDAAADAVALCPVQALRLVPRP